MAIDPKEVDESLKDADFILSEANLDQALYVNGSYILEGFLSSDGKNTVHFKAFTADGKKAGMKAAEAMFERWRTLYGTKQGQAVKEYSKEKEIIVDSDLGNCPKCNAPMKLSAKGKKYCSKVCWKKE